MTGRLIRLALVAVIVWTLIVATGRAVDNELASGSPSELQATTEFGVPAGGLAEREVSAVVPMISRSLSPSGGVGVSLIVEQATYQGLTAREWARRAVQNRKNSNKRGRTIRRLQAAQRNKARHFFAWLRGAECVHREEGAWDDPNPPYWGGMQADLDFMRAYGLTYYLRWGTADNWPMWAQLHMAYNGWIVRGWQPWPNTSRECGLR